MLSTSLTKRAMSSAISRPGSVVSSLYRVLGGVFGQTHPSPSTTRSVTHQACNAARTATAPRLPKLGNCLSFQSSNSRCFSSLVDVLSGTEQGKVMISGYSRAGFTIDGVEVAGSVLVLPSTSLLWEARTMDDITEESLQLFTQVDPPIEILLIGTGQEMSQVPLKLQKFCRRHGIIIESMSSRHACGTFNFLNQEGRAVGAAILALEPLPVEESSPNAQGATAGPTHKSRDDTDEFGRPY